ncbi:DUF6895 family protein [Streptomyces sp. NPDC001480]|uniref:DUF6895 family protein n=1 Tax=Streptomyces sp. NPDC001480 TaxID=3364577 RepID=UPI0036C7B85E
MTHLPCRHLAQRMASTAIGWLHRHREHGAFPPGTSAELADPNGVYKPLGESALAACLLLRTPASTPADRRLADSLLSFAWEQLGNGALLYERQLRYPAMTDPLEVYAHFARAGYRHDALHELEQYLTGLASHQGSEHLPNRRLAVANAAHVAGLPVHAHWPTLTAATWLGHTPEPWTIDWMTGYAVTHTVFHITDWGAEPHNLRPALSDYLATWLPVWTDIWAEIHEWDLVAELLIAGLCLPDPVGDTGAWQRLAEVQRPDGLMPPDSRPIPDDPDEAFRTGHHTTVVAAIAATLALAHHQQQPVAS